MSDADVKDPQIEKLEQELANDAALERMQDQVKLKKAKVDDVRYTQELQDQEQERQDREKAKNLNFGAYSASQSSKAQQEFKDYIAAAKNKMVFINESFNEMIPFFQKNLILIGAHTGRGKSTAAANITHTLLKSRNEKTGKPRRILIITNEERAEDFYARVVALLQGWHYVNHDKLTPEQVSAVDQAIPALSGSGRLVVVDNTFGDIHGMTTTTEGIESIFENLLANKEFYDVVIIDYYQNIISSKKQPHLDEFKVQAKLAKMLDQYKNIYPAPIVLLCQADPESEHEKKPFKQRINGRKLIIDHATLAMEMTVDYHKRATEWTVWKSRFTQAIGKSIFTGYDNGKYVIYDDAFIARVQNENDRATLRAINSQIGQESGEAFENMGEQSEANGGNQRQ